MLPDISGYVFPFHVDTLECCNVDLVFENHNEIHRYYIYLKFKTTNWVYLSHIESYVFSILQLYVKDTVPLKEDEMKLHYETKVSKWHKTTKHDIRFCGIYFNVDNNEYGKSYK